MKLSSLFFFFSLICSASFQATRKNFKCKSFDPKTIQFEFCKIEAKDGSFIFFVSANLLKNISKPLYLQASIARKTKQNYFQDYFRTELIECCDVLSGGKTNPFIKGIIDGIGKNVPDLIHPCPYLTGLINVSFVMNDAKTYNFGISGTYKIELNFYTKRKLPFFMVRSDQIGTETSGTMDFPKVNV